MLYTCYWNFCKPLLLFILKKFENLLNAKKMTKKLLAESDMYIRIVIKRIGFIKIKSLKIIIKFISSHKVTRLSIKTKYAYKNDRRKNKWIAVTQGFLYKLPTKFHIQNVALQKNKASVARLISTST